MRIDGAADMSLAVGRLAPSGVREIEAAIDQPNRWVAKPCGDLVRLDQRLSHPAHFRRLRHVVTIPPMAIDVYWGSGSAFSWCVLLALEYKGLPYESHLLQFSRQEHKSPHILAMNFRGRVPILKDDG